VLSEKVGTCATSWFQIEAKVSRSASCQWLSDHHPQRCVVVLHRPDQRTRRSISPSSSMMLGAGVCTAARVFTSRIEPG
jgi:hypothetical protein